MTDSGEGAKLTGVLVGGLWSTPPVSNQPMISLTAWCVFEVTTKDSKVQRHFVGHHDAFREGRVSTAIVSFDAELGQGVTASGRRYLLVGEPGHDPDGVWVWQNWSKANGFTNARDVTAEYLPDSKMSP